MEHGVRESKKIYFSFNPTIELATPFLNRLSVTFSKILVGITNLLSQQKRKFVQMSEN